ncbi:MAG: hypothetical protein RR988_03220 [Clostridia bacterium]
MKKGIALVTVVAVVVIMSILISTISISGMKSINNTKKMNFAKELKLVQDFVASYKVDNNEIVPSLGALKYDLTNIPENIRSEAFSGETLDGNSVTLLKLDLDELGLSSLSRGVANEGLDIYAYSDVTGKVYYMKGVQIEDKIYYTLTEELIKILGIKQSLVEVVGVKDGIFINKYPSSYTNDAVSLTIRVPAMYYSGHSVSRPAGVSLGYKTENGFTTYRFNAAKGYKSSYEVIISYKLDNKDCEIRYKVNNIDKTAPVIDFDKVLYRKQDKSIYTYITGMKATDNLSGVKCIKYGDAKIESADVESFFKSEGKVISGDRPQIKPTAKIGTLYVEDNAGNFSYKYVEIPDEVLASKPVVDEDIVRKSPLTPIKWSSSGKIIETTTSDPQWADYSSGNWGNAMTPEGSMWVWIPRYAYRIIYYDSATALLNKDKNRIVGYSNAKGYVDKSGAPNRPFTRLYGDVEVVFLGSGENKYAYLEGGEYIGNVTKTTVEDNPNLYVIHPAFSPIRRVTYKTTNLPGNYGWDKEITGFWVGKFENTSATFSPKPGMKAATGATPDQMYKRSQDISKKDAFELRNTNIDAMLIKNTQWGAVTYLANATAPGKMGELNNNGNTFYTGGGAGDAYIKNFQSQSTTGNVSGVYDMNGNVFDATASYFKAAEPAGSGFELIDENINTKFVDTYRHIAGNNVDNYELNADKYGDSVYEVSMPSMKGWQNTAVDYPSSKNTVFVRGGYNISNAQNFNTIFRFEPVRWGPAHWTQGYRTCLITNEDDARI